jgi:hypothetical protein
MDIAYDLADYIADNFGYTMGTDIFVGQIPDDTTGLLVVRAGGTLNNYLPVEQSVIDIYAKYLSADTAYNMLEMIKRWLHRMHSVNRTDDFYYSILGLNDIVEVSRDLEGYKIIKFGVLVTHRDKTLIS